MRVFSPPIDTAVQYDSGPIASSREKRHQAFKGPRHTAIIPACSAQGQERDRREELSRLAIGSRQIIF
ncbi:hypothetical protein PHYPO_G00194140 [Pangasianodon hypophthalmus]|uniref:Uncharacterized protein n=1 Tax=Pangasianodon hypophthalmus TaxID=310915 RepID=A0A5N5PJF1_PANHP|nr:hypothetical protein PHYPO_G00194140 [Pangasianodon hypophthalmus]